VYLATRERSTHDRATRRGRVPAVVVLLGITSMLTDISSEMVTAVLPLYLTLKLSFSAVQFGGYVAVAEAAQALLRIGSGVLADRTRRHKDVAVAGYATSAASRLGIVLAGGAWAPTTAVLLADRVGKGVRTAPRDAMISLASPPDQLGRSFGVHRALDAAGALAGPVAAFAILAVAAEAYDSVFMVSFAFAIVGLAVLVLFVPPAIGRVRNASTRRLRVAITDGVTVRLTAATAVLGSVTIGDAFVFLAYRRVSEIDLRFFPLLFTGAALVYLVLAVPVGRLSDRVDRRTVMIAGYAVLGGVYIALWFGAGGTLGAVAVVAGLGTFYACTDGVVAALVSAHLPDGERATGLAVVATGAAMGRATGAFVFGWAWSQVGADGALAWFAIAVVPAIAGGWWLLASAHRRAVTREPWRSEA
jgi:MFS family permease